MEEYRVFISYSHEDRQMVDELDELLRKLKVRPMWDKDFSPGSGFHKEIKQSITHAHIFLPLITESSSQRGWVHQEIGYAMAYNIPVLPVAKIVPLGEMLQGLHALQIKDSVKEIEGTLTRNALEGLVASFSEPKFTLYQCAELGEDRTMMMIAYAERVSEMGVSGYVRQKGALSSFNIPDKSITHPDWKTRYGSMYKGAYHCRLQLGERLALEQHARNAGCRLIVNPDLDYHDYGVEARIVRLQTLLQFLKSMPAGMIQVAINRRMDSMESVTMVDDWFFAESISSAMGEGYRQTMFTHHAPSMRAKIEAFDKVFFELIAEQGWTAENSRDEAVLVIEGIISQLGANRS